MLSVHTVDNNNSIEAAQYHFLSYCMTASIHMLACVLTDLACQVRARKGRLLVLRGHAMHTASRRSESLRGSRPAVLHKPHSIIGIEKVTQSIVFPVATF